MALTAAFSNYMTTVFKFILLYCNSWIVSLSSLGFTTLQTTVTETRRLTALKHKTSPQGAKATSLALWCLANWTMDMHSGRFGVTPEHTAASVTKDKQDKRSSRDTVTHTHNMGECLFKGAFPTDSEFIQCFLQYF